jgi:hypothetical protein
MHNVQHLASDNERMFMNLQKIYLFQIHRTWEILCSLLRFYILMELKLHESN